MLHASPLNDHYLAPASSEWTGTATLTMPSNQRVVMVVFDFMLLDESNFSITNKIIFGSASTNWWFDVDVPAAGVNSNRTLSFNTVRNAVAKSSAGTIEVGKRYVCCGVDDGTNVTLYINGVAQTASSNWTTAQASYPIVNAAVTIWNDAAQVQSTPGRLYEAMVRAGDEVVLHWRPRPGQSGVTLSDLSDHGNNLTITSATAYAIRSIWARESAFPGKENLPWP